MSHRVLGEKSGRGRGRGKEMNMSAVEFDVSRRGKKKCEEEKGRENIQMRIKEFLDGKWSELFKGNGSQ